MAIFLGIDGGGSKTVCLLGDEVRVLAQASGGASNVTVLGEAEAAKNIEQVIRQACVDAKVQVREIGGLCAGMAGVSAPGARAVLQKIIAEAAQLPTEKVHIVGDMEIALEDAFPALPGIVVMAGTGSIAFGRDRNGRTARAGGWGWAISDEGSGRWIGREAVAAILRAHDAGRANLLGEEIFRAAGVSGHAELVQRANSIPAYDFSKLFPAVLDAAGAGDDLACDVLRRAGIELAGLCAIVIRQLWSAVEQVRVALGGGVLAHSSRVRQAFWSSLRREYPNATVSFRVVNPAQGALALARRLASRAECPNAAGLLPSST